MKTVDLTNHPIPESEGDETEFRCHESQVITPCVTKSSRKLKQHDVCLNCLHFQALNYAINSRRFIVKVMNVKSELR